jgi:hypothetical protein
VLKNVYSTWYVFCVTLLSPTSIHILRSIAMFGFMPTMLKLINVLGPSFLKSSFFFNNFQSFSPPLNYFEIFFFCIWCDIIIDDVIYDCRVKWYFIINLNTFVQVKYLGWMFILQPRGTRFETSAEERNNEFQLIHQSYLP